MIIYNYEKRNIVFFYVNDNLYEIRKKCTQPSLIYLSDTFYLAPPLHPPTSCPVIWRNQIGKIRFPVLAFKMTKFTFSGLRVICMHQYLT